MKQEAEDVRDAEVDDLEPSESNESAPADETPEQRIARLEAELEEANGNWKRAQADYQNLRRRSAIDYERGLQQNLQPLFEELLLVQDYLEMALSCQATTDEAKTLAQGVEMTKQKLLQTLENAEVHAVETDGPFDPAIHEAVGTKVVEGAEPGTIVEVVRRGYVWRKTVLRPARVVVAADPDAEAE